MTKTTITDIRIDNAPLMWDNHGRLLKWYIQRDTPMVQHRITAGDTRLTWVWSTADLAEALFDPNGAIERQQEYEGRRLVELRARFDRPRSGWPERVRALCRYYGTDAGWREPNDWPEEHLRHLPYELPEDTPVSDVVLEGAPMPSISTVSELLVAASDPLNARIREMRPRMDAFTERPAWVRQMPTEGITVNEKRRPYDSPITEGRVEVRLVGPGVEHSDFREEVAACAGGHCTTFTEKAHCPPSAPWCAELWRRGGAASMGSWQCILYVSEGTGWRAALAELLARQPDVQLD